MTSTDSSVPQAFLYGSCVARDTLELVDHRTLAVASYTARQSLLSAGSNASAHLPRDIALDSAFQRRMIKNDFAGSLLQELQGSVASVDVLLWDLADERHGVHRFPDGTFVTRSIDNVRAPEVLAVLNATEHLPLGSPEHLELWSKAAENFTDFLRTTGLLERTAVLEVPWALLTTQGRSTPWSMGMRARDANRLYQPYYAALRSLGHLIIEVPPEMVLADPDHKWGLAPFHYTEDVYQEVLRQIRAAGVIRIRPKPPARPAKPRKPAAQKQAARKRAAANRAVTNQKTPAKPAAQRTPTQKRAAQQRAAKRAAAKQAPSTQKTPAKPATHKQTARKQASRKRATQKQAPRNRAATTQAPTKRETAAKSAAQRTPAQKRAAQQRAATKKAAARKTAAAKRADTKPAAPDQDPQEN